MALPPDQALDAFAQLFADDPAALQAIEQTRALPEDQKAQAVQLIGQQILGG